MITSKSKPEEIIESLRAGANDYLVKPFDMQELEARLKIGIQLVELNQIVNKQRAQIVTSSKMAILGEMASNIAHEINNPLTIIGGHAEHLLGNILTSGTVPIKLSAADLTKSCSTILETTKRIGKIIKSLKAFAYSSNDEDFESIRVQEVLDSALTLHSSKLKKNDIHLKIVPIPNLFIFEVQSTQICQILVNLIDNAYLAIKDRAEKWIKIECAEDSENIMISITDSGPGIPEHIREKIMLPFYTTRPPGKGTGLGLSISQTIIESHQGSLIIDETSSNTRFVISIPKTRKPQHRE